MNEAIAAIAPVMPSSVAATDAVAAAAAPAAADPGFGTWVTQGLERINGELRTNEADLRSLAAGDVDNLHQVMIRLEESRLSFMLMMQVRNRLLESYQEVMRTPI
jgi:flagellar hook-basal body complex protein FliE